MAGLWLNQCGETDDTRQRCEITWELAMDGVPVITGDDDFYDLDGTGRTIAPSAFYTPSRAYTSGTLPTGGFWQGRWVALLDREMDPGWWLLEWSFADMLPKPGESSGAALLEARSYTVWDDGGELYTPSDAGLWSVGVLPYYVTATEFANQNASGSDYVLLNPGPCQRVAFVLVNFSRGPGTGEPLPTVTLSALRVAGVNCPEPEA